MDTVKEIQDVLTRQLAATVVEVTDDSVAHAGHAEAEKSGGGNYAVMVVSPQFQGKTLVARHRMVYYVLQNAFKKDIHALVIKAMTPEEFPPLSG